MSTFLSCDQAAEAHGTLLPQVAQCSDSGTVACCGCLHLSCLAVSACAVPEVAYQSHGNAVALGQLRIELEVYAIVSVLDHRELQRKKEWKPRLKRAPL